MVGLNYVGGAASASGDTVNVGAVTNLINAFSPSRVSVDAQLDSLVGGASPTYATKVYVDNQDATFVEPIYYETRDALNVPKTLKGVASGVATLDNVTGKVPAEQIPNLGNPYVLGPFGLTGQFGGSTGSVPIKIAEWNLGQRNIPFRPLVFLNAFVKCSWGQPVIEVKLTNTTTAPAYDAVGSIRIGLGVGRYLYNDYQSVVVLPSSSTTGGTPSTLAANYNIYATAWLYDRRGAPSPAPNTVTLDSVGLLANIASSALYLLRGAQ